MSVLLISLCGTFNPVWCPVERLLCMTDTWLSAVAVAHMPSKPLGSTNLTNAAVFPDLSWQKPNQITQPGDRGNGENKKQHFLLPNTKKKFAYC